MLLRGWHPRWSLPSAGRLVSSLARQRAARQACTAQAPATPAPPPPPEPSPSLPHSRGPWQRGSRRQRLPPAALLQLAEQQRALSAASYDTSESEEDAAPPAAPISPYQAALQASLTRTTLTAEQLLELASGPPHQRQQAAAGDGDAAVVPPSHTPALASALAALHGRTVTDLLESWEAVAHERPPGCDRQQRLELPGLADAAAVSRVGRLGGQWKASNQDALLLQPLQDTGPAGALQGLLLGVLDGHGLNGEQASATAAAGIAASMQQQLAGAAAAPGGNGGGSSGGAALQQALVTAFQTVAASMAADATFVQGGAAAVVCAVSPGSLAVAWAGDCRAVVGLALQTAQGGPTLLVHPLTTDHRPDSPLEMQRIVASGAGRVLQLRMGGPPRLCGLGQPNTLALSRAFGDTWALQLGLTAEADAVTIPLPPPVALPLALPRSLRPRGIASLSTDGDDEQPEAAGGGGSGSEAAGLARHVLVCGSDGLWDMVENEEAVAIALSCGNAEEAAHALVQTAHRRWAAAYGGVSVDDCTAAVAFLT